MLGELRGIFKGYPVMHVTTYFKTKKKSYWSGAQKDGMQLKSHTQASSKHAHLKAYVIDYISKSRNSKIRALKIFPTSQNMFEHELMKTRGVRSEGTAVSYFENCTKQNMKQRYDLGFVVGEN